MNRGRGRECEALAWDMLCADAGAQGAEAKTVPKAQRMGAVFAVAACVTVATLGLFFWHLFCLAAFVTAFAAVSGEAHEPHAKAGAKAATGKKCA